MNHPNFNKIKDIDKDKLYYQATIQGIAFHQYSQFITKALAHYELSVMKRVANPERFMTERDGKLKPKAILDDVGDVKYYLRVDDKISEEEDADDVMVLDSSSPVIIKPDGKLK